MIQLIVNRTKLLFPVGHEKWRQEMAFVGEKTNTWLCQANLAGRPTHDVQCTGQVCEAEISQKVSCSKIFRVEGLLNWNTHVTDLEMCSLQKWSIIGETPCLSIITRNPGYHRPQFERFYIRFYFNKHERHLTIECVLNYMFSVQCPIMKGAISM